MIERLPTDPPGWWRPRPNGGHSLVRVETTTVEIAAQYCKRCGCRKAAPGESMCIRCRWRTEEDKLRDIDNEDQT